MFVFQETKSDKERAKELREYQYGNPFLRPYCRTIIDSDTGESIGAFHGFLMYKEDITSALATSPDTLFMCFDSIDQVTYEFYHYEIEKRKTPRSVFVALDTLVLLKLERIGDLEEIIAAFRKHIESETSHNIEAMYALNMYQSETATKEGYFGIDNDDYPKFKPVAPRGGGDPGLFCRREFK